MTLRDPLYKPARLDHRILLHGSVDEAGKNRFEKIRRKQGVRVPSGNMFTDQDVKLALAHVEDNEDVL